MGSGTDRRDAGAFPKQRVFIKMPLCYRHELVSALKSGTTVDCVWTEAFDEVDVALWPGGPLKSATVLSRQVYKNEAVSWQKGTLNIVYMATDPGNPNATYGYGELQGHVVSFALNVSANADGHGWAYRAGSRKPTVHEWVAEQRTTAWKHYFLKPPPPERRTIPMTIRRYTSVEAVEDALFHSLVGRANQKWLSVPFCDERLYVAWVERGYGTLQHRVVMMLEADPKKQRSMGQRIPCYLFYRNRDGSYAGVEVTTLR